MPPAIAAVAVGIAAGVAASSVVVGIAVAIGTVALQNSLKPDMPGVDESAREAQTLTTEPLQPRRGIYGETVVSGSIVGYGKRKMGDKEAHVVVITLADHNIESAELYEVNGKPKPSGTTYQIFKGDQTAVSQTALQYCDGWTENHIGFGVSYAVVTIPIDPEEMPSGLQNVTFKAKGKRVYDPRKDTTVGGDGPHRPNDETTWEWSDNTILCALDYQRFHGYKKLGLNKFDMAHIMDQANVCDEIVHYTDNNGHQQSEKRFTCNGSWTFDQSPSRVLERIMSSCGGKPYRRGGKMYLQTASYHGMAEITLNDTDAAGEITITPHRELKDRCNLVRASFQDPKKGFQPTDAPVVTNSIYVDRDGMELEDDLQLNFTNSSTMAQRLMKYHLERNRAGMRLEFPCKSKGLLALAGTTVRVDLPNEGIDKEFIVQDWQFDFKSKKTKIVLEEESPELYSDSLVPSEGNVTPNTELPDFTRPDAPESLAFEIDSVSTHRQGYVTWSHPTPRAVTEYRVLVRKDGDDIVEYPVIARSGVQLKQDINGLDAGQYSIEVYARNRYDRTSVPATISLTLNEPSPPTSLGATAGNWEITLAPTLAGIGLGTMFEFAYGTPDNIIGRGANIVIPGLTPDTEHDVYARTVNILGQSAMRHETIRTTKDTSQVDPIIETYTNRLDEVDSNFQSFVENEFTDLQQLVNDNAQEINVRFSNELFERERNDATVLRSIIDAAASRNELRRRIEKGEQLIGAVLDVEPVSGTITNLAYKYADDRFTEAQLRLDGVAGEINATVERLTFNEQRVTQLGAEINLLPGVIDQRATAIVADSIAALEPAHAFNFFDSAQGWTAVTGTITPGVNRVLLETGDITNSGLAYNGQEYPVIRMSVRRTAGENWLGNIVVTFTDDSTESYPGIIEPIEVLDTDVIRIVDFTALNSYHGDIKALRITLGQDNTDTFELKSLSIGKPDAALQDLTNIQAQVVTASSRIDALSGEVADKVDVETWTQEGVTRTNVESVLNGIEAYATMKVTYQEIDENGLIEKANDAALFIDGYEGTFTSYVESLNQRLNEDGETVSQQFTTVENKLDAQDGRIRSQALSTSSTREGLDSNILEDLQSAVDYGLYRFDQLDKDVRFSLAIDELQAITGPEGSIAQSIQNLQSVTQQDGQAIEAQAQRLALAETTIDGYARALQVMSARVGSQEDFAKAQLELNASYNETLESYEAYAFLGVEQVQNGRAVLTGVTFGGSQNAISFRGDVFQWEDTSGNLLLHYDTDEGVAYLRARLVLGDGFTVTTEDDIRGLDGEQGPPGPQGPEGPVGPQGVPGEPGADGQVYYTWIRYADDINGNGISNQPDGKFYMGLAYNKTSPTESNDPSDYTWSRFRGEDGTDGVQGPPGEDGQTTYTWIAYSDNADGSGMYQVPNSNTKYIGIATNKTTASESSNPSDYTWSRFRGEDGSRGPQGVQGPPGEDGQVYYTWIRYATGPNGEGISNSPSGMNYMGLAYNKTSPTESNDPSDYTWSRFRGEDGTDGVQGPPGEDGQTTYTWIAYSDNADGSGMYQVPNSNTKYIGIATNKTTASESSNPSDYTWSRFRGEDGATNVFFTGFDEKDVTVSVANSKTTATRSNYNPFSGTHSYVLTTTESAPSSSGSGNVAYITIPRNIAMQFAGQNIEVALYAKKLSSTPSGGFGVAYSVGSSNSGFTTFNSQWNWTKYTFDYFVPENAGSSEHYIVINPDTAAEGRSLQIDNVTVGRIAVDGADGEVGTPGAGMYGQSYDTITWSTATANSRFNALVGRNPVPLDIFVQTLNSGEDSQARQWNGSTWVQPTLMINGSLIARDTVAGNVLIAGTELNSPIIKSGRIELTGSSYMSIQTSTPFGPNNLLEWKGPRNSYTYDETNKLVKFDGLTKANALAYFSEEGDQYFGGSITAGTLKNAVQTTQLGSADVTVGPFGSNGGIIEIKCSISAARGTGLVSGTCPYPTPSAPTGTMRLYRQTAGGEILVATQNVNGSYNCSDEGPEYIESWQLSGSFTYTDNLQTASNRTYRLEVTHNLPIYPNGSQSLSLITEEA